MVVSGHIQTGNVIILVAANSFQQRLPAGGGISLESTAAGTGHVQADTHILPAVIEDIDVLIGHHAPIPIPAVRPFLEGDRFQTEKGDKGLDAVALGGKGEPVEKNAVFR